MYRVTLRLAVLVALAASAALYLQYLDPMSAPFCGLESGCEAVRRASFSYFFGSSLLSMPLVGLLSYGAVFAAALFAAETRLPGILAVVGGVMALVLLGVQAFVVKAFCWLCAVVDVSAVVAGVSAVLDVRSRRTGASSADPLRLWAWLALAGVAVAAPVVWTRVKPAPPISPLIAALYVPGKVNVVEFADFECPYCRKFHAVLQGALRERPADKIRFLRKHVPLPSHDEALPAARAVVCAEAQGLGEKLADKLVEAELSPAANRRAALEVGVDPARFDQCLASTEPDRRIDADSRLLEQVGMLGLPTTYIEGKRLLGAVSAVAVRDALDRAFRGESDRGVPGSIYAPLVLLVLLLVAWLGRAPRATVMHERPS